ncbi:hypothetical protein J3R30DRAFT_2430157 [Lentinula aciculospora]|uniref:Uncharacterized protein n=1 Tax=Lentinula aciculospora TaxID=153920 RepID=A0A9W9AF71_9AGAR|nr:hypothetical protein J3R30DRAFT_2430157 [Lentinula aciculospora]
MRCGSSHGNYPQKKQRIPVRLVFARGLTHKYSVAPDVLKVKPIFQSNAVVKRWWSVGAYFLPEGSPRICQALKRMFRLDVRLPERAPNNEATSGICNQRAQFYLLLKVRHYELPVTNVVPGLITLLKHILATFCDLLNTASTVLDVVKLKAPPSSSTLPGYCPLLLLRFRNTLHNLEIDHLQQNKKILRNALREGYRLGTRLK